MQWRHSEAFGKLHDKTSTNEKTLHDTSKQQLTEGALPQLSSSFLFIKPIKANHASLFAVALEKLLVNDNIKALGQANMTPSIISNVTNTNKEFGKRVRPTSFQKTKSQPVSILHKFRPSVPSLVFAVLFVPSFTVFSSYFKVLLSLVEVLTV